jgi:hypothetical protein
MTTPVKQIMTGLDPGSLRAPARNNAPAPNRDSHALVRLIEPPLRGPATEAESFAVALLGAEKEIVYGVLVSRVAEFLYRKELRDGGWLLDLGLFGSGLFVADAKRELRAGRDVIWEID